MLQTLNVFSENQPDEQSVVLIKSGSTTIVAASGEVRTSFVGVSPNNEFFHRFNDTPISLLTIAVNNRTRERNYFRLYSQYLNQEISEEEFEHEIERNENLYVLDCSKNPTRNEFETAYLLAKDIIGVENTDDFLSLFSFSEDQTHKLLADGNEE